MNSVRAKLRERFFSSAKAALITMIVVCELLVALPQWVLYMVDKSSRGALTDYNVFLSAVVWLVAGGLMGLTTWILVVEPLRKKYSAK